MSSLLVRGENGAVGVTPESAGWRYVSFNALRIPSGGRFELDTDGSEACIVVIGGRCAVRIGDIGWPHVGARPTPFDGPPHAVYAPPGTVVEVDRYVSVPSYESWWEVPVAATSEAAGVRDARKSYEKAKQKQRRYL